MPQANLRLNGTCDGPGLLQGAEGRRCRCKTGCNRHMPVFPGRDISEGPAILQIATYTLKYNLSFLEVDCCNQRDSMTPAATPAVSVRNLVFPRLTGLN